MVELTGGGSDDPHWIHTDRYDDIVREGMRPYDEHFNDDLGLGGWENINAAHYALIEAAIDARRGQRLLVTFGAWHKHWLLARLERRRDLTLIPLSEFLD